MRIKIKDYVAFIFNIKLNDRKVVNNYITNNSKADFQDLSADVFYSADYELFDFLSKTYDELNPEKSLFTKMKDYSLSSVNALTNVISYYCSAVASIFSTIANEVDNNVNKVATTEVKQAVKFKPAYATALDQTLKTNFSKEIVGPYTESLVARVTMAATQSLIK